MIEMTIPSSLDGTIAPPGKHVVQLFVQYVPYRLAMRGKLTSKWWEEEEVKAAWVEKVLNRVETFCPGFKKSILHVDALSPLDLEVSDPPPSLLHNHSTPTHPSFHSLVTHSLLD